MHVIIRDRTEIKIPSNSMDIPPSVKKVRHAFFPFIKKKDNRRRYGDPAGSPAFISFADRSVIPVYPCGPAWYNVHEEGTTGNGCPSLTISDRYCLECERSLFVSVYSAICNPSAILDITSETIDTVIPMTSIRIPPSAEKGVPCLLSARKKDNRRRYGDPAGFPAFISFAE